MADKSWQDVGAVDELKKKEIQEISAGEEKLALIYRKGRFTALSGTCAHAGGPIPEGKLDGNYVVCPWHQWKFDIQTGVCLSIPTLGVACYEVRVVEDQVQVGI